MKFWKSDIQWWLLKKVVRWYVRDSLGENDPWTQAYVGVNSGAVNGADEFHLAYIGR